MNIKSTYITLLICLFYAINTNAMLLVHKLAHFNANKKIPKKIKQEDIPGNNLIMIFDPLNEEGFGSEKYQSEVKVLAKVLQERVAPIVVTQHTVNILCQIKEKPYMIKDYMEGEKLTAFAPDIETLFNDWLWYAHEKADLMLLIPKTYLAKRISTTHFCNEAEGIKSCGFDISNLNKIDGNEVADYIAKNQKITSNCINIIDACISMFTDNPLGKWFIYMTGHGGTLQREPHTARECLDLIDFNHKKEVDTINKLNSKDAYLFLWKKLYESSLKDAQTNKEIYEARYKEVDDIPDKKTEIFKYLENSTIGAIAGLHYNDFFKLMSFFNKIGTSFVHCNTCHGGGFNQAVISEIFSKIKAHFTFSTVGYHECLVGSSALETSYTDYFTFLSNSFTTSTQSTNSKNNQITVRKDPITRTLENISGNGYKDQPFVYTPSTGMFTAISVDKKVKILTNAIAQAHEHEGTVINCTNPEIKTIFIYPPYVVTPIEIGANKAVVAPAHQTFDSIGINNTHILEKVTYQDKLSSMIPYFIGLNISHDNIVFVIKELHCFDYENSGLGVGDNQQMIINNMLLCMKKRLSEDITDINLIFTHQNSTYSFSTAIENIEERYSTKLFNTFKAMIVKIIDLETLQLCASHLFNKTTAAKLDHNNLTTLSIIKELETEISEKMIRVNKSGSLDEILKKKLQLLPKRVTTPVSFDELTKQHSNPSTWKE